jgi:dienelactone hydrolase
MKVTAIASTIGAVLCAGVVAVGNAGANSHGATGVMHGDTYVKVSTLNGRSFQKPGPYAVGEYSIALRVTDANDTTYTTTVEVWYPAIAAPGARSSYNLATWVPASLQPLLTTARAKSLVARANYTEDAKLSLRVASGVFPLVLYSHGYAGVRDSSSYLTTRLASWGFVVAAPDHVTRDFTTTINSLIKVPPVSTDPNGDVADLLATIKLFADQDAGLVGGHVDPTHVIVLGHSAGAITAEKLAAYESVDFPTTSPLKGWIAMAGASLGETTMAPYDTVPTIPGVMLAADHDHVAPLFFMKDAYDDLGPARRFVELRNAGHQVFTDACAINDGHGATALIADALGSPLSASNAALSSDGCFTSSGVRINVTPEWEIVDQVVVASARYFLGFDASTKALVGLQTQFPSLVVADTTKTL